MITPEKSDQNSYFESLPELDLDFETVDVDVLKLIPEKFARKHSVLAVGYSDRNEIKLVFGDSALFLQAKHLLRKRFANQKLLFFRSDKKTVQSLMPYYKHYSIQEFKKLIEQKTDQLRDPKLRNDNTAEVKKIVNLIIDRAFVMNVSDVHIEAYGEKTSLRFRIDGVLFRVMDLDIVIHEMIVTRLKVMANLYTDEHNIPQDGKIVYTFQERDINIRVSVVPTIHGENIVLRLLAGQASELMLTNIGMTDSERKYVEKIIGQIGGMILIAGPTGSGKTTTLYSILKVINDESLKIITIEDPVEYDIDGVTQIQINERKNLTFETGLRSILRHDPDVVMVGEIRDEPTAQIAVDAAMTGHLVMSTIHTNDAPTALPRLLNMDINPFLIASTVKLVISQRLMRRLCSVCKQTKAYTKADFIKKYVGIDPEPFFGDQEVINLSEPAGCEYCGYTGYEGRIGAFEVMVVTEEMRELIMQKANSDKIREFAKEQGMRPLLLSAARHVLDQISTVDELIRVIKI